MKGTTQMTSGACTDTYAFQLNNLPCETGKIA